MAKKWPQFVTKDLPETDAGAAEMQRRWETYDREMKAIIAAGGVHQDDDGWWVDDATGELIGPDPEIERPIQSEDLKRMQSAKDVLPPSVLEGIAEARRSRGRPSLENPKQHINIRLDADLIARLKADGPGWQSRANNLLRKAVGM
ncbi:MAG TPA: BrnA antitoxin family protein [Ensifer sp.]|nr:BrnA antitoxin family protein [Ensifer sp.]